MSFFRKVFKNRKYLYLSVAMVITLAMVLILQFFILDFDLFYAIKMSAKDAYLLILEKIANPVLMLTGSDARFDDYLLYYNGLADEKFIPEVNFEKLVVFLIIMVWLTKSTVKKKATWTVMLIAAHLLASVLYLAADAFVAASGQENRIMMATVSSLGMLIITSLFFLWFRNHKTVILQWLSRYKVNTGMLRNDLLIMISLLLFIFVSSFLIEIFDFNGWISVLFGSSKWILSLFGYEAVVNGAYLTGAKGMIMMSKSCLGFHLILLFIIMILLTGNNSRARWIYMLLGVIVLNIMNILRFVFLFVHLEKHGDYALLMEAHGLYNLFTYIAVFLLWILWFEKFADKEKQRPLSNG